MKAQILKVDARPASAELKKHKIEVGKRYVFVDSINYPKGKMYAIARVVRNIRRPYEPAELRKHSVDAVMIFMGKGDSLKGLAGQVNLNGRWVSFNSPVSVYVPAGVRHSYKILKGSGTYMKIVLAPGGNYNAVTK